MRIVSGILTYLLLVVSAEASDIDWKVYGGASVAGPSFCFYDANVIQTPDHNVRVWTKCLGKKELAGVTLNNDTAEAIAKKIAEGYVPPIVAIGKVDFKQLADIAIEEEIADEGAIEPQTQIFLELNCAERMSRTLSISLNVNGQRGFKNKPGEWEYVPPEGNSATLLKLLCPLR